MQDTDNVDKKDSSGEEHEEKEEKVEKKPKKGKKEKSKQFDARDGLSSEMLEKLETFRKRISAPLDEKSPIYKEALRLNQRASKKKEKRKTSSTEPPELRLWTEELTEKHKAWLDDMCLCRYLRARDWDLNKSEIMLRGSLAWREDYKPDEITLADIEEEAVDGKIYFNHEFMPNGWPIVWMKVGKDKGADRVRKLKFLVWSLERLIVAMDASRGVEKMCWITDFRGTGAKSASKAYIQLSLDCLHTLLNQYPERLGVAYAVNPPKLFSVFWKMLTPFMNEVTLNKIKFVQPKEYPILIKDIGKDIIEKEYGGSKEFVFNFQEWRKANGAEGDFKGDSGSTKDADHESDGGSSSSNDEKETGEEGTKEKGKGKKEK